MSALLHDDLVRVYELPEQGSGDFLFGKPHPTIFHEVDWFNALPPPAMPGFDAAPDPRTEPDVWQEKLLPFLQAKRYVKPGRKYLALCIHRSFVFEGKANAE